MKRLSVILFGLVFLFTFAALAQDMNPDAGKLYNEGNSLLKAGNYNGAVDKYDQALRIEKDYRTYYQRGVALKKSRDLAGAKTSFEECLVLNKEFAGGYNALGGVYFSMGDYNNAITNFDKVLALTSKAKTKKKVKKNLSLAYSKLGDKDIKDGNPTKAIKNFKKAVEYNKYDAAYLSLAKLYSELAQWDNSIAASENALKYRSKITKGGPYYYMGVSFKGKGNKEKAKEMFNKAKSDATYKKTAEYELTRLN
jgi:tetratricopeptide (TPR) repeat protein